VGALKVDMYTTCKVLRIGIREIVREVVLWIGLNDYVPWT